MHRFFYRGRHRRKAYTARKTAACAVASATVGLGLVQPAHAGPPGGWGPVITCESGGRNVEHGGDAGGVSSASGYLQFVDSTWRAYGGAQFAARAIGASLDEQMAVAERAYAAEGLQPWAASRSCWAGKVATTPRVSTPPETPARPRRAPQGTPPAPSASARAHVVVEGDTLSEIAAAYRTEGGWPALHARNRGVIGANPDLIFPGQRINL